MQERWNPSTRQCCVRSLWCLCFSSQWLHFVGKSENSAAAFSWPGSRQLPRLHTTEKMSSTRSLIQLLLSLCNLLFKESAGTENPVYMEIVVVVVNVYVSSFCFQICVSMMSWNIWLTGSANYFKTFGRKVKDRRRKTYLQWRGTRPLCGSAVSASPGRGK